MNSTNRISIPFREADRAREAVTDLAGAMTRQCQAHGKGCWRRLEEELSRLSASESSQHRDSYPLHSLGESLDQIEEAVQRCRQMLAGTATFIFPTPD